MRHGCDQRENGCLLTFKAPWSEEERARGIAEYAEALVREDSSRRDANVGSPKNTEAAVQNLLPLRYTRLVEEIKIDHVNREWVVNCEV